MPWPVLLMARELGLGGSERQLCETAKNLDRARFEPHVGCFHARGFRADELRAAGVPILELPVRSFHSVSALEGARLMIRYIREHRIQAVHTFDVPLNVFGVPVARMSQARIVLSSQRAHRGLTPGLMHHLLRLTDLMVDAVVVNSLAVRRQLIEEDRVPPSLIRLCYNGIDPRFEPGPRMRPPALADAELVIGTLCAFRPEKGLDTLLEAFARVRHLRPGLKLLLVGGGPSLAGLRELSARLKLEESCVFEPPTADAPAWMRAIDIFVLPSLSEALSNSLMEALASGCCSVASDIGGNPELIEPERTGLLFRAGDAGELAGCLGRLIPDDALRDRLAEAGAAKIRENFTLASSAQRMGEIYAGLLEATTSGAR